MIAPPCNISLASPLPHSTRMISLTRDQRLTTARQNRLVYKFVTPSFLATRNAPVHDRPDGGVRVMTLQYPLCLFCRIYWTPIFEYCFLGLTHGIPYYANNSTAVSAADLDLLCIFTLALTTVQTSRVILVVFASMLQRRGQQERRSISSCFPPTDCPSSIQDTLDKVESSEVLNSSISNIYNGCPLNPLPVSIALLLVCVWQDENKLVTHQQELVSGEQPELSGHSPPTEPPIPAIDASSSSRLAISNKPRVEAETLAIHAAVAAGDVASVEAYIARNADKILKFRRPSATATTALVPPTSGIAVLLVDPAAPKSDADSGGVSPLEVVNLRGRTPLHTACVGGHIRVVEVLLAAGADANAFDNTG